MIILRRVEGNSMNPAYRHGQIILMMTNRSFKKGDVVVAYMRGREVVKRIQKTRSGAVFLLGDNGENSSDSRHYGWIKDADVLGTVIWPRK